MGRPTADDPLGMKPDFSSFGEAVERLVDERIEKRLSGRAHAEVDGIPDMVMVRELLARGWAVFRPQSNGGKDAD